MSDLSERIKQEYGQDYVFILEKVEAATSVSKRDDDYILEGVAAVFGQENNNHRIYEEKEYLPHLEYLQKKIEKNKLLGELDHPANFETSLKNASHVVEKLEYDKANRQIKIRIKLINGHPAGEMAKALVNAGVPLHVSSRAAGVVKENKKVQIKKIFTYDLVCDPGFEQAQMNRIYESVLTKFPEDEKNNVLSKLKDITENFVKNSADLKIYKINEDNQDFFDALGIQEKNNTPEMSNGQYVTFDEMNDYSRIIKKEMDAIKGSIKQGSATPEKHVDERLARLEGYVKYLAENVDKNIRYSEYLAENLDKGIEYTKYLAENVDKTISYTGYLAENLDKNISYSNYLAENLDKNISYSNYLAENLEKGISYTEYLAENLDKNISYANYLAENLDRGISYAEYLAENLDKNISYSNYLAENLDRGISYSEYLGENLDRSISYGEYLAETVDKAISYGEYLGEKIEKNIAYSEYIAENVNVETPAAAKTGAEVNEGKVDYSVLSTQINSLLESAKNQKASTTLNESKYSFYKVLNEDNRKAFTSLDETKKEKVVNALTKNAWFTESDILLVWESALVEKKEDEAPLFIKLMPEDVKPIWESMSSDAKQSIYAASTRYKLENAYAIKHFWHTRLSKKDAVGLIPLNETESANVKPSLTGYGNAFTNKVAEELGKRFKK